MVEAGPGGGHPLASGPVATEMLDNNRARDSRRKSFVVGLCRRKSMKMCTLRVFAA